MAIVGFHVKFRDCELDDLMRNVTLWSERVFALDMLVANVLLMPGELFPISTRLLIISGSVCMSNPLAPGWWSEQNGFSSTRKYMYYIYIYYTYIVYIWYWAGSSPSSKWRQHSYLVVAFANLTNMTIRCCCHYYIICQVQWVHLSCNQWTNFFKA